MVFETPQQVLDTIQAGDEVERIRGENRVAINNQANGRPPLSAEEARKMHLKVNVNWNEFAQQLAQARRQILNALMGGSRYFTITIPDAPIEYRENWGNWITSWINRRLKKSKQYFFLKDNQCKALVGHGIGPTMWEDKEDPLAGFVAIEDLRIPTDTTTDFDNLCWFARRKTYTPGELAKKVWGRYADPNWNKEAVAKILNEYWDENFDTTPYDWMTAPEKMAELIKQNLGYYSSDAVPAIQLWHFYFYDEKKVRDSVWRMHVLPERNTVKGVYADVFLYDGSDKVVAKELSEILQVQFADLSNKAPAMYHSIRGLGFMLLEPCFWTNLARCRSLQYLFESFQTWMRSTDPVGKARPQEVQFFDRAFIPEGISFVNNAERPAPDKEMLEMVMANLKQLISEQSSSYTQQADTGTRKEQTAYETSVKLSSINAMMSAIVNYAVFQEAFADNEICRRLCLRRTENRMAKEFQAYCRSKKIPPQYVNSELWDIAREVPLGGGNPILEQAEAQQLMAQREKYPPGAQQVILHRFTTAVGGADLANQLVPLDQQTRVTQGQERAEFLFGTLMQGVPAGLKEDVSPIEQMDTLIGLTSGVIARIESNGNMASASEIAGLQTVVQYMSSLLAQIAQNPNEKKRVQQYKQTLGKLVNPIKGFIQRLAEQQQQQQGGPNPELAQAQGKIQARVIEASAKSRIAEQAAAQKRQHKNTAFLLEQDRKNAALINDLQRQDAKAVQELQHGQLKTFSGNGE